MYTYIRCSKVAIRPEDYRKDGWDQFQQRKLVGPQFQYEQSSSEKSKKILLFWFWFSDLTFQVTRAHPQVSHSTVCVVLIMEVLHNTDIKQCLLGDTNCSFRPDGKGCNGPEVPILGYALSMIKTSCLQKSWMARGALIQSEIWAIDCKDVSFRMFISNMQVHFS